MAMGAFGSDCPNPLELKIIPGGPKRKRARSPTVKGLKAEAKLQRRKRREERALQEKEAYDKLVTEAKSWLPQRPEHQVSVSAAWDSFDWEASDDGTTHEADAAKEWVSSHVPLIEFREFLFSI